jgi:CubicO group peptidase (beta-lactamase class C family)
MNYYKQVLSIVTIFFLLTNNVFAQSEKIKQIDSLMKWSNQIGIFNGNVLVSKNNKVIYNTSFGYADATKTNKLTTDYRFHIGSITKEFSAVALLKLQEQGKLRLDDTVSKFIPELPKWANKVTIRNLLQYTSGLPNVNWRKIKNDKDIFNDLKLIDTLVFRPGTNYDYNNNNMFLRQFIVERLTGMSFKTYSEKFIFKPCKMNSSIMTPFENEKNIAKGFNNEFVQDPIELPLTGGTYLTTVDLLKWANCLHSKKVINKQSIYEIGQNFNLQETQSGLGRAKFKNKDLKEHLHDGRAGNFEAILFSDIDEKFTIVLLDNNYNGKVFEISNAIRAILKSESYNLPKKSFFIQYKKQLNSLNSDEIIALYNSSKLLKNNIYDVDKVDALNSVGYYLMENKRLDDSVKIFNLNIQEFPSSYIVYDSMGEAYFNNGKFDLAILNYKKSLELDAKNDNAKNMISKIKKIQLKT